MVKPKRYYFLFWCWTQFIPQNTAGNKGIRRELHTSRNFSEAKEEQHVRGNAKKEVLNVPVFRSVLHSLSRKYRESLIAFLSHHLVEGHLEKIHKMKCNKCWKKIDGPFYVTTCSHIFCTFHLNHHHSIGIHTKHRCKRRRCNFFERTYMHLQWDSFARRGEAATATPWRH